MTPTQSTLGALFIALPILGFGVAPKIFTGLVPAPQVCDQITAGRGELNGEPAMVFHLCDSPFVLVGPMGAPVAPPALVLTDEPPDFLGSPPALVPGPILAPF